MIIRAEQMKTFEQDAQRRFEDEMVAHAKEFSPRLCHTAGDEQVRAAVRSAIARAAEYGFTNRGPIRLFIELMLLFGHWFDKDPQYPELARLLGGAGSQMERAQQLHEWHNSYLARVSGPDAENARAALGRLLTFARAPHRIPAEDVPGGLLREMKWIYPEKAFFTGEPALRTLIGMGIAEAQCFGFTGPRPQVVMVVLKFGFGHGCAKDPLYPWIGQTLSDERITGPEARVARLEKKAITWLEHVIAADEKGSRREQGYPDNPAGAGRRRNPGGDDGAAVSLPVRQHRVGGHAGILRGQR